MSPSAPQIGPEIMSEKGQQSHSRSKTLLGLTRSPWPAGCSMRQGGLGVYEKYPNKPTGVTTAYEANNVCLCLRLNLVYRINAKSIIYGLG